MYVIFYMGGWLIVFVSINQIDERAVGAVAGRQILGKIVGANREE